MNNSHDYTLSLVTTALDQTNLSGLCEMLRCVSEATGAHGCILWELTPGADLNQEPPIGLLFVLAHWFPDQQSYALHDLPLKSATGEAILSNHTVNVQDISTDERVYTIDPVLSRNHINAMCSVPLVFVDGAKGALNLYRSDTRGFTAGEILKAEELSSLIPRLYQVIRDKVSQLLLSKVDEVLHGAEVHGNDIYLSLDETRKVVQIICSLVRDTFQCIETSAFLENRIDVEQYELAATTWPGEFSKQVYRKDEDGLTAWVLNHATPLKILDLAHFQRDVKIIQGEYPGINWTDSLGIAQAVRQFRGLENDAPLPPLSFMAVPVVSGSRVLGVLRCCAASVAPYFFAARELSLLQLVAARLSQYWSGWLRRCEMEEENRSWRALGESVAEMNKFVHHELTSKMPDERRIFREGLRIAKSVIPTGEISDVRLHDDNTGELYFAEIYGPEWSKGSRTEIEVRKQRRFSTVDLPPTSAGAHVFQTGKVYVIPDVTKDPYYSETFHSTKRVIIAPNDVRHRAPH